MIVVKNRIVLTVLKPTSGPNSSSNEDGVILALVVAREVSCFLLLVCHCWLHDYGSLVFHDGCSAR